MPLDFGLDGVWDAPVSLSLSNFFFAFWVVGVPFLVESGVPCGFEGVRDASADIALVHLGGEAHRVVAVAIVFGARLLVF